MIRQVQQNLNGPMNNGKIASGVHANGIARNVSTKPTAKAKGKSKAKARPKTRSKKNTTMSVVQSTHANIRVSSQARNYALISFLHMTILSERPLQPQYW